MPNTGAPHTINTGTIADNSIMDADVNAAAQITRTKMNQAQNLDATTGAKVRVFDATNAKSGEISHSLTEMLFESIHGDIILRALTGVSYLWKNTVNSILKIYGGGGVKNISITHNDTNAIIANSSGALFINSPADTYHDSNLYIGSNKMLYIPSTGFAKYITLRHNDTNGLIDITSGNLHITAASGIIQFIKAGVNNIARFFGSGGVKYTELKHDDTDGHLIVSSGKLILNPATTIDANNKEILGINKLTLAAAKSVTRMIPACAFKGTSDGQLYSISAIGELHNTDGAFGDGWFSAPLDLPDGVTLEDFYFHNYRDDAASNMDIYIYRNDLNGTATQLAHTAVSSVAGYNNIVLLCSGNVINNGTYSYYLLVKINNNNSVDDARITGVKVNYNYTEVRH